MWQAPDLKRRAQMAADRQAKQRRKSIAGGFSLRKAMAEIRAADDPETLASAQVLLNDVTPQGMHLFTDSEMPVGEFVQITLTEPRAAYVRARVSFCQEITSEIRVISARPYPYRMSVIFIFSSEEEERVFKSFVDEICAMIGKREISPREGS